MPELPSGSRQFELQTPPSLAGADLRGVPSGRRLQERQAVRGSQHAPVFIHLYVAFAAEHHQISVVAEVAVPFDDLLVAPGRVIPPHLFIVHAVEIGAQIDAGFIQWLICRFLLEVPNRLSHIENQSGSRSANCPVCVASSLAHCLKVAPTRRLTSLLQDPGNGSNANWTVCATIAHKLTER